MDAPETRPDSDLLSGWKDIASYLGKSVRSAQRWEADYGLPVHRITTPDGGQVIYASRREIETWRRDLDVRRLESGRALAEAADDEAGSNGAQPTPGADDEGEPALPASSTAAADGRAWWIRFVVAATALNVAILAAAAWLAWPVRFAPARFELHGTVFRALSASDKVVWQHDFGGPVQGSHAMGRRQIVETDLDGDGSMEIIAVVRMNASSARSVTESDRIVAFDRSGRLLWSVQPTYELRDAERSYPGPWVARALAVEGRRVAAGFSHPAWRPNFVVEIDGKGQSRIRYVQGGWIQGLVYWRTPRGLLLAMGGDTGDLKSAIVAIIDADGPGGREPAPPARALTCPECPGALVRELYLFPTSEVTRALFRPWGLVQSVQPRGGDLGIWIGATPGLLGAVAFLSADGAFREYSPAATYWEAHRQLSEDHQLDHPVDACPERSRPVVIRRWTSETQWTELTVSPGPGRDTP